MLPARHGRERTEDLRKDQFIGDDVDGPGPTSTANEGQPHKSLIAVRLSNRRPERYSDHLFRDLRSIPALRFFEDL
jgi:hypothetical protein